MRFLVVDIQLPFILGMDHLKFAYAKVDLIAGTLILCTYNGIVATLEGTCKWTNLLSVEVSACII